MLLSNDATTECLLNSLQLIAVVFPVVTSSCGQMALKILNAVFNQHSVSDFTKFVFAELLI